MHWFVELNPYLVAGPSYTLQIMLLSLSEVSQFRHSWHCPTHSQHGKIFGEKEIKCLLPLLSVEWETGRV